MRPSLERLGEEDRERFAAVYCGLCRTLDRLYGAAARFILNYDFTFLAVLLSPPQAEEVRRKPCMAHPFHAGAYFPGNAALETAADCSVILAWWQLKDGAADHRGVASVKYQAAGAALSGAYKRARRRRESFDRSCQVLLERLSALEKERCPSIDRTADTFAQLLRSIGREVEDPLRRRVTEELLYHLGRWIYLVDAADDLEEDFASGNYNPLICRFALEAGRLTAGARESLVISLDQSIRRMAAAYELWDFGVWSPIIQSTVYEGLFCVGKAVLEGSFQAGIMSWHGAGRNKERL